MLNVPDHPDVASALRTGYATFQNPKLEDTPENRDFFIDDHTPELVRWLRLGHQEILDEFIEFSDTVCAVSYQKWIN